MQPNNFYPTVATGGSGIEYTGWIPDLHSQGILQEGIGKAYAMGYIPYDDSPKTILDLYSISIENNNTIRFAPYKENRAWGYCWQNNTGSQVEFGGQMYGLNDDNSLYRFTQDGGINTRFTNKIYYSQASVSDRIRINIAVFCTPTDNINENGCSANPSGYRGFINYSYFFTRQEIKDFLTGNFTVDPLYYYDTASNTTHSTTLNYNEFNTETHIAKKVIGDYTLYIFASSFSFMSIAPKYAYEYSPGLYTDAGISIVPFFINHVTESMGFTEQDVMYMPYNNIVDLRFYMVRAGSSVVFSDSYSPGNLFKRALPYWFGDETINVSDFSGAYGMHYEMIREHVFIYVSAGDGLTFSFVRIISFEDVLKFAQILNAVQFGAIQQADIRITNPPNYGANQIVSLFTEDNAPKYEYEQGDIAQAATPAILQPWQMPNNLNTVNDFDTDDIPEYEPPEPGEEGENIGDVIHRPASIGVGGTNGFVTQYALRKADILDLGEKLWTSFIDADYWQNYMFSLALDTGTLALSGLLNFFLSCKVYPFPLINIAGCAAWGNAMFVGTGVVPLPFNRTIYALNSTVDYVNGGECIVWSNNFYGDYRDYINTKITLYVPYCGTVELNPGDVVGNTLKIQYAVDFATGGCIAYVDMTSGDGGGYPVAALTGQIGADIPLTATAAGDVAARFVGDAMKFGGLIGGSVMDTATGMISAGLGAESEKAGGGGSAGDIVKTSLMMQSGLGAGVGFDVAPGVASQLAGMLNRPAVSAPVLAGGRGFASFGAPQVPYIQIRRAIYPAITGLSQINGNPGAGTYKIGDLSGFVQGDIITDGLQAPENEKQKIRKLFANGVYV